MATKHPLILFIYKTFYIYSSDKPPTPPLLSTGLKTSAQFVVDMLLLEGIRAKLVEATDQNGVQALVTKYQPARVILEAIWVTPAKMQELIAANPKVKWTVRVHSEMTLVANEGMAIMWLDAYLKMGVEIAFNSPEAAQDFDVIGAASYLPNYYPLRKPRRGNPPCEELNIGCFGSIRPLKNQLVQALAAVRFAQTHRKRLTFHMNGVRIEQSGANNLKNIKAVFAATGQTLDLHEWMPHEDFLELIAEMDICLQVSLTESFNIVSADADSMGVPLVGSAAIKWLPTRSQALVDSVEDIVAAMNRADATTVIMNQDSLRAYLKRTVATWIRWVG